MSVQVRRMGREHVDEVVRVHLTAFGGFFLTSLGPAFLRAYYRAAAAAEGALALVAVDDGEMLGFAVGNRHPAGFYRRLLRRRWLAFAIAAVPGVLRSPSAVPRVFRALTYPSTRSADADAAGLFSIAVAPSSQGSGVGHALLAAFEREAVAAGARRVVLETDAGGNDAANAFYRSAGYSVVREYEQTAGRRMLEYVKGLDSSGGPR